MLARFWAVVFALAAAGCARPDGVSTAAGANEHAELSKEWQGVYQGPYHIYLTIEQKGEHAEGTWRAMGGRRGELWGDLSGNVLRFAWRESDTATPSEWSGRGFFVLHEPEPGRPAEIRGEWGFGSSDTGRRVWAVKRPSVRVADAEAELADSATSSDGDDDSSTCIGCRDLGGDDYESQ